MLPIKVNGHIINKITIDSRDVTAGCLFVCIEGDNFDGHDFAEQAAKSGAALICAERPIDCSADVYYVESTRAELLRLAGLVRSEFTGPVVAITGSVGKTTTKELIACALSEKYNVLKTAGNLNNDIGVPKTIFTIEPENTAAVIEMGMNHAGEIKPLSVAANADAAVITNVGTAHIGNFIDGQAGILKEKLSISKGLKRGAPIFVCGADERLSDLPLILDGHKIIRYNISEQLRKSVSLPGEHNLLNAAAAEAVGRFFGLSDDEIFRGLSKYVSDSLRQNIKEKCGIIYITDCYNASPDSMKAAINLLSDTAAKRRIAVIGDMKELGGCAEQFHKDIGEYARCKGIDLIFSVGCCAKLYGGKHFRSKAELAECLKKTVKAGDAVLFKASRAEKFEEIASNFLG
jgi:UDP-N-acetylmuramyl pentapeptide synthase